MQVLKSIQCKKKMIWLLDFKNFGKNFFFAPPIRAGKTGVIFRPGFRVYIRRRQSCARYTAVRAKERTSLDDRGFTTIFRLAFRFCYSNLHERNKTKRIVSGHRQRSNAYGSFAADARFEPVSGFAFFMNWKFYRKKIEIRKIFADDTQHESAHCSALRTFAFWYRTERDPEKKQAEKKQRKKAR